MLFDYKKWRLETFSGVLKTDEFIQVDQYSKITIYFKKHYKTILKNVKRVFENIHANLANT